MGGSGSYFSRPPEDVKRELREAQESVRDEEYEAAASEVLSSFLAAYNNRDHEAIRVHLDEIAAAIEKDIDGTVNLGLAGSAAKHTYVDGLSDIDCLVKLDSCELADQSPQQAKEYLAARLAERFPKTEIEVGTLAVTIRFTDAEIQLLPAVSCQGAVKIADSSGQEWARIRPQEFAAALTDVNQSRGGKVVPSIKLAKAIIATLPDQQRISGYHVEALAVAVFRDYSGPNRTKDMLQHFFEAASQRVLAPIKDRTGQSIHVDEYLGAGGSVSRHVVSDTFSRIARRMSNADAASSVESWREFFGES